jgi:hypothetical protein
MTGQDLCKVARLTSKFFGTAAIACFAYFELAPLLLHIRRPDYAPTKYMISDYANGRHGWVMTTCFLALSCGCFMLLVGLVRSGPLRSQLGPRWFCWGLLRSAWRSRRSSRRTRKGRH